MTASFKQWYSRFLNAQPERLHFAAHSHHFWPDVSRDAHLQAWDDAATLADHKWDKVFGEVIPEAQSNIRRSLGLSEAAQIAFAPNTHEFVARILSCFEEGKPLKVLTSDGEFHSFTRQIRRYGELKRVEISRIKVSPFANFTERFLVELKRQDWDLVFVSQVFFQSGYALSDSDVQAIVAALPAKTTMVLDSYHGFCALPTSLGKVSERIFITAGGYKYAQSGEGVCFLSIPPQCSLRPLNTGWFASFAELEQAQVSDAVISFSNDAFRFWGATFDPSGLYRFNAVQKLLREHGLAVENVHRHVKSRQSEFLSALRRQTPRCLVDAEILMQNPEWHGHFLSFRTTKAAALCDDFAQAKIVVDSRGDILRFGFALYHDASDVDQLLTRISKL